MVEVAEKQEQSKVEASSKKKKIETRKQIEEKLKAIKSLRTAFAKW